jgi:hypothetical protein
MFKKMGLILFSITMLAEHSAFALPSGSVSKLEPSETQSFKMQLLQDIGLDRLIESDQNFYANSADHIVDGKLMTSDEYSTYYAGQSYCEISVFNFAANTISIALAADVQSEIVDTIEIKDSNWKDGAYNWSSLRGVEMRSRPYISSVTCSYKGSLRARLKPQLSIEVMKEMLRGVVEILEVK